MADDVQIIPGSPEPRAKIRHPVLVVVWTVLTLGIYSIYWWYQINREMVDLGKVRRIEGLGDNATLSLLAYFPGSFVIIPAYVSLYNGSKRIQRAQGATTQEVTLNGWIILVIALGSLLTGGLVGVLLPGYVQSEMNHVWTAISSPSDAESPPQPPAQPPTP